MLVLSILKVLALLCVNFRNIQRKLATMVATTSTNSHSQAHYQNMSAIEPGCVEEVYFMVRDLYTGRRTLRQVKHEEISKVSFVFGQLATQVNIYYR